MWGKIWGLIGGLAIIVTIVGGGIAIKQYIDGQTASFSGDVTQSGTANAFIQFLTSHDGKAVQLSVTCANTYSCMVNPQQLMAGDTVMPLTVSGGSGGTQTYWVHVDTTGSDAQADNGPYGAGALVIKGNFEVSVRGGDGITPPNVQNIYLKGVNSTAERNFVPLVVSSSISGN